MNNICYAQKCAISSQRRQKQSLLWSHGNGQNHNSANPKEKFWFGCRVFFTEWNEHYFLLCRFDTQNWKFPSKQFFFFQNDNRTLILLTASSIALDSFIPWRQFCKRIEKEKKLWIITVQSHSTKIARDSMVIKYFWNYLIITVCQTHLKNPFIENFSWLSCILYSFCCFIFFGQLEECLDMQWKN